MRERFFPDFDFDWMNRLEQNLRDALNLQEQSPEIILYTLVGIKYLKLVRTEKLFIVKVLYVS